MGEIIYELPEDVSKVIEVIEAVPSDWHWIEGTLYAPRELYDKGNIMENTRLVVPYNEEIKVVGKEDVPWEEVVDAHSCQGYFQQEGADLDISQVLSEKSYSSVIIESNMNKIKKSYELDDPKKLRLVKDLTTILLSKGYRGNIKAVRNNSLTGFRIMNTMLIDYLKRRISLDYITGFAKKEDLDLLIQKLEELGIPRIEK